MRDRVIKLQIPFEKASSFGKAHPSVRHECDEPPEVIVKFAALGLHGADGVERQRCPVFDPSLAVIVDPSEGVGEVDADLAGSEVDHRTDGTEDPRDAATCQTALDKVIAEGVGICFCVSGDIPVAAYVDHVATATLGCPVEGHWAPLAFEPEIDRDSFRQLERLRAGNRQDIGTGGAVGVLRQPQHVLSRKVAVFDPQVIPILIKHLCGSNGAR